MLESAKKSSIALFVFIVRERILMNRSYHQPKKRRTCVVRMISKLHSLLVGTFWRLLGCLFYWLWDICMNLEFDIPFEIGKCCHSRIWRKFVSYIQQSFQLVEILSMFTRNWHEWMVTRNHSLLWNLCPTTDNLALVHKDFTKDLAVTSV